MHRAGSGAPSRVHAPVKVVLSSCRRTKSGVTLLLRRGPSDSTMLRRTSSARQPFSTASSGSAFWNAAKSILRAPCTPSQESLSALSAILIWGDCAPYGAVAILQPACMPRVRQVRRPLMYGTVTVDPLAEHAQKHQVAALLNVPKPVRRLSQHMLIGWHCHTGDNNKK